MEENDGLDGLRDLLSFSDAPHPKKKARRRRGDKQFHWDKEGEWGHYSSHREHDEAIENTPTEPGTYLLVRGSRGSFIIRGRIVVKEEVKA